MRTSLERHTIFFFFPFMVSVLVISAASDSLNTSQSIADGETLVSADGTFELGFFSPGDSKGKYLGIWYKKVSIPTVVWVANREVPVVNSPGVLRVTSWGILVLVDRNSTVIWSSNSSRIVQNPVAQLLDSGNLLVKVGNDDNPENILWQSFEHPGDTLLPGMKLGRNLETGEDWYISSWKSKDDPSVGDSTFRLDPSGFPQLLITLGSIEIYRSGPWNGLRFSGSPKLKQNQIYSFHFFMNKTEMYYIYNLVNSSVFTRMIVNQNGVVQRFVWIDRTQEWSLYLTVQTDNCDSYAVCGAYGSCNIGYSPQCECLKGFIPKSLKDWNIADWSDGCARRTPVNCQGGDGFIKYSSIKLPDTRYSWFNVSMTLAECEIVCLKNCSCTAYATLDISDGSGCLLWFDELIDIRDYRENGQDAYVRMASSEIDRIGSNKNKKVKIVISVLLTGIFILGLGLTLYAWKKKQLKNKEKRKEKLDLERTTENQNEDIELPLFDLASVVNATNNFSADNKIGEGGFGPVYKGTLDNGQEIAVKKLSRDSKQGLDEFKNEVLCIAKLQHRNLVKLLGCCIEEEKMLIYEYMPNKSLDSFIFDKLNAKLLSWRKRYHIINGIARGLLYLHQDSRLRIIHRDMKTSNILLDHEMNPKISDFGTARSFGGNETEANTTRVVGTYGYMSPEYAVDELFSVKSDVFSFGVIVLEIISGKRNRGFAHRAHNLNLLGHAWRFYNEGRALELLDPYAEASCNLSEVLRSIQVGLLCVQRCPEDRPSMSSVVLMLGSENVLPQPKEPGFYTERNPFVADSSSINPDSFSANEITFTLLSAR